MSIRKAILGPLWLLTAGGFVSALGLLVFKVYDDSNRSRERGRLVASIVRGQSRAFDMQNISEATLEPAAWPDDFGALRNWVVTQAWQADDLPAMARKLKLISSRHSYSHVMQTSLQRWDETLNRWATESARARALGPDQLIAEARQRYFEATGYQKIGRQYDAAILYLWSAAFLSQFVQAVPDDPRVPEALFILGDSYLRVQHALPGPIRSDRILNLCSELYPDSIWASRADSLWKEEVSAASEGHS